MIEIAYFIVPVLGTIFIFALIKGWLDARTQANAKHLKLLEEALKNPAVDRATLESLAFQLTGNRAPSSNSTTSNGITQRSMAIVMSVGWIGLFAGLAILLVGQMNDERLLIAVGAIAAIVSFGLVTYPIALRELQARRVSS